MQKPEDAQREQAEQQGPLYLGVVSGGYEEPIPTDAFKVTVNPRAAARVKEEVARWAIVRAETDHMNAQGQRRRFTTFGVVDDIRVLPGHAFRDAREMGQSGYYREANFQRTFSSVAEDALELTVRSLGHLIQRGNQQDLYGPVRPPERESRVYLATPQEVQTVLMKPMIAGERFNIGAYATLHGLYRPVTALSLPREQMFLHGAIFASTRWGKTVTMKHLIQEFSRFDEDPPAIIVFNLKQFDMYGLETTLGDGAWDRMREWNPSVEEVWNTLRYGRLGIPKERVTYYPISVARRGNQVYSIFFNEIEPNEHGDNFMRVLVEDANLPEASMNYLLLYLHFFKQHFTHHNEHDPRRPGRPTRYTQPIADTLKDFIEVLNLAYLEAQGRNLVIQCNTCQAELSINRYSAEAIHRALAEILRLNIFDTGAPINLQRLITRGHISVIDAVGIDSARGKELFIRYLLHSLFQYINGEKYKREHYRGVLLFLDEAWRFFRSPRVLDEVEQISRMGAALRMGLWLADQTIPDSEKTQAILNNTHTIILGALAVEPRLIKRLVPLDEKLLIALNNLARGHAIFFHREYSRIPVPAIIPPCRCAHEG